MFETPIFYVMSIFFTDYTNVGQTFSLICYTSYDNVILMLCKHLKHPGFFKCLKEKKSVIWLLQEPSQSNIS